MSTQVLSKKTKKKAGVARKKMAASKRKRPASTPSKKKSKKKKRTQKSMSNQTTGKKAQGESVETIRDILFGEQMADYDQKFAELEAALRAEVAELKTNLTNELRENVAELKSLVQKEREESNDRNVARRQLGDKLQKIADDLRK